jgi:hypothetical protein
MADILRASNVRNARRLLDDSPAVDQRLLDPLADDVGYLRTGWVFGVPDRAEREALASFVEDRVDAIAELSGEVVDVIRAHEARYAAGQISESQFVALVEAESDRYQLASYMLGQGSVDIADERSIELLRSLQADREARLGSLGEQLSADEISIGQYRSRAEQGIKGSARAGAQLGNAAHFRDEPIRRVLTPEFDHCETCPPKARTYSSFDDYLSEGGNIPGDGGDDCHGNCGCSLEASRLYSVYEDTRQSLVARGGVAGL